MLPRPGLQRRLMDSERVPTRKRGAQLKEEFASVMARAKVQRFSGAVHRRGSPHRHELKYRRLSRSELPVDTVELAQYLIGKTLVHDVESGRRSGRIVETEAYVVGDAAAHAFRGMTPRNRSLFLERGHAYVYFCYGCWFMLNVSGETEGIGAGVLFRALEPLESPEPIPDDKRRFDLARGPGRLARWMQVDRRHDGLDLCGDGPLWLATAVRPAAAIGESVRIGITREAHRVLRFYEKGSPFVSGSKRMRE